MTGSIRRAADPLAERGVRCFERAEFERAAECFERAAAGQGARTRERAHLLSRACECRADLARALAHAQCFSRAERELASVLAHAPGSAPARLLRARLFERSGRVGEALDDLARLADSGHRSVAGVLLEACCRAALRDRAGFREALDRATALALEQPAQVMTETQAPDPPTRRALLPKLRRAVALRPAEPGSRIALAELLLDLGEGCEAELHLDAASVSRPGDSTVAILRGRALLERGAAADAVRVFEALAGFRAAPPDVCGWLGLARYHLGDLAGARSALERALLGNRRYAAAWRALALVHHAAGDLAAAARAARQAQVRHRERPEVAAAALECVAHAPDPAGLAALRRAVRLQSSYPDLRLSLARALRATGEPD